MWIKAEDHQNCTIIASKKGPMSLQQIGDILGVTRMRICQIEKKVVQKLSALVN
jgi:DNA-directed RNA polymerase specialized sigma subunit